VNPASCAPHGAGPPTSGPRHRGRTPGHPTDSLLIARLHASSRPSTPATALHEHGRLVRTTCICRSVAGEELQRRHAASPSKGESLHTLRRDLFFAHQGHLRRDPRRPDRPGALPHTGHQRRAVDDRLPRRCARPAAATGAQPRPRTRGATGPTRRETAPRAPPPDARRRVRSRRPVPRRPAPGHLPGRGPVRLTTLGNDRHAAFQSLTAASVRDPRFCAACRLPTGLVSARPSRALWALHHCGAVWRARRP